MYSLYKPCLAIPAEKFRQDVHPQLQSPLFAVLPAEIRVLIFTYALSGYYNEIISMDSPKVLMGSYWKPWMPRRNTHTDLLRTCKRIFQETWFMPLRLTEHKFLLESDYRHWNTWRYGSKKDIRAYVNILQTFTKAPNAMPIPQIPRIRVWVSQGAEANKGLGELLNPLKEFQPKCVTFDMSRQSSLNMAVSSRYDYEFYGASYSVDRCIHQLPVTVEWPFEIEIPVSVNTIKIEINGSNILDHDIEEYKALALRSYWFFRREDGIEFKVSKFEKCLRTQHGLMAAYDENRILNPRGRKTSYITGAIWTFTPEVDSYRGL